MHVTDRLRTLIQVSRSEQTGVIRRKLSGVYPRLATEITPAFIRKIVASNLAAPKVLHSSSRFYVAYRPNGDICFDQHPELRSFSINWVANNVENNAGDLPRLYALLLNIKQIMAEAIAGDFAKLGVYRGNSAAVLARYARQYHRSLFLFDTFAGFEGRDLAGMDKGKPLAFADTSIELVRENVGEDSVSYIKGYFPQTITREIEQRRFAVVHLDCDLYEPMRAGLEFFFPRLSPGGLMIIHDYSNLRWDGTKRAVDEYLPRIFENLVLMPDKSGTAMIRKSR